MRRTRSRAGNRPLAIASLLALGWSIAGGAQALAAEAAWPASVAAHYKLAFGGFDVGGFDFKSQSDGKAYTTTGTASVSALFGAFKWSGEMNAKGALNPDAAQPSGYQLDFKTKSKGGSVALKFDKGAVNAIALVPNKPPSPEAVPVKPDNLKSVFDPLTSILALTHAGPGDPCNKTIPIFDGKARFDLVLSRKGQEPLTEKKNSGQPAQLVVCRVKYVPIAGHKPKDFESPWVSYNAIEIALRPIPSAHLYVPYRVTIPTTLGAAIMTAEKIEIIAANKSVIALTQ